MEDLEENLDQEPSDSESVSYHLPTYKAVRNNTTENDSKYKERKYLIKMIIDKPIY